MAGELSKNVQASVSQHHQSVWSSILPKAKEHNKSIIVVIDYIPESIQQYQEQ